MNIEQRIKKAKQKIQKGHDIVTEGNRELTVLQNECPHTDLEGMYQSDTGNWDRSSDYYRLFVNCPLCGYYNMWHSIESEYRTTKFKLVSEFTI